MGAVTSLASGFGGAGGVAGTTGTGGAGGIATGGVVNLGFGANASALTGTFNLASALDPVPERWEASAETVQLAVREAAALAAPPWQEIWPVVL